MHQYMSLTTIKYKTFPSLSITTFFSCSGFPLHMISTEYHFNLKGTYFPIGILACRYAPVTSEVPMALPLYVSMTRVENRSSNDTVVDNLPLTSFNYVFTNYHYHMSFL